MGAETAHMEAAAVQVFWRPGCSSCARVKEFLASRGVPFESVDVAADPAALQRLAELGIRSVPVVMRGDDFTFAQSLDDVSKFLRLSAGQADRLPPEALVMRWREVLDAARILIRRVPADRWLWEPVPEQSLVHMAHHIFRIPISFLACVEDGVEDWVPVAMAPPPPDAGAAELEAVAADADAAIVRWWGAVHDPSCAWEVRKYDGVHTAHVFLERQVWHSAHHTRQLAAALTQIGVDVAGVIRPGLYDDLPMPAKVW